MGNLLSRTRNGRRPLAAALICRAAPAAAIGALALAGCGGGGSGGAAAPPPPAVNRAPNATFTATTTNGIAPLAVQFNAGASSDPDGVIDRYDWDFGDGTPAAAGVNVNHTFAEPGTFSVRLRVFDDDNASDLATTNVRARGAQLSGTIQILASSAVDSDVNDRFTTATSNNDFASAQQLPNPVRLGGFVNRPGTPVDGELGNLFDSGDPGDFYAVDLAGDELIVLSIGEQDAVFDLGLWDQAQNAIDLAAGTGTTKTLLVPAAGRYFISVIPVADPAVNVTGGSNYVLSVGQDPGTAALSEAEAATTVLRLSDDFVPGELILRLQPTGSARRASELEQTFRLRSRGRVGQNRLFAADDLDGTLAELGEQARGLPPHGHVPDALLAKYQTLLAARALLRQPGVADVSLNYLRQPLAQPNDTFYGVQWHYPIINLPQAWDITTGNTLSPADQVIVAVVDTGILANHPDLPASQRVPGYDFISDPARARDGNGIDSDPTDNGDLAYGGSSSFHGTHVAGTVAAASNNQIGVAGVAWGAKVMPIRVLGVDGGTTFDVMQGIAYAAGLDNNSTTLPAQRADIINLSLGSSSRSNVEEAFIRDEVICVGVPLPQPCPRVIVVASAGNSNSTTPSYPAAYTGVISVSATTINNSRAPYSNSGSTIDVAAPGGYNATDANGDGIGDGVISTLADDSNSSLIFGYAALAGTSMAAPHVAGVAALMKDAHPGLTPQQFEAALAAGLLTDDLGAPGRDNSYGYGLINAQKAVLTAVELAGGGGTIIAPILTASVGALNFGAFTSAQTVSVRNLGTQDPITLQSATASEAWLRVEPGGPITINAGLAEPFTITVERNGLADGSYAATVTFDAQDPAVADLTITVTMQVSSVVPSANAGLHYVILVNAQGESVLPAAIVSANAGIYPFTIRDVPVGSYRLFAGSDMDDDSFLCDASEACGAYRTLDAPGVLDVDANTQELVTGLDFVSEFRAVITSAAAVQSAVQTDPNTRPAGASPLAAGTGIAFRRAPATAEEVRE